VTAATSSLSLTDDGKVLAESAVLRGAPTYSGPTAAQAASSSAISA